ncbi:MAG: histidine kinase, partial [Bacteroidota bacterium]|nr:histidine kinase [Bacteroidota bacterium]
DDSHEALKYGREGLAIALQTKVNQNIRDGYQILSEAYGRLQQTDSSDYYFRKYSIIKDVVLDHQTKGIIAAYSYRQRISLMNKEEEIQAIKLQNETWTKNVLIGSLILLLLFAFIFSRNIILKRRSEARRRELAENELWIQKLESEKSKAELLQQRTELEMKALRAQMNPHFIFNCLNSINRFIIGNNTEKAADYLTKFAKLIRIVLEKSGKSFIPLVEELDSLKLYMDLEALRFEKPFRYEINGRRLDQERIMVPSLMIQPFVENAIWHGLGQHTQDQGKIKINLSLEKEVLHCEIIDNGIGMRGSAALKRNNEHNKQSLGIEITKNRLRLAGPHLQETLGVFINELKDEMGNNTGTSVLLKIPVKVI